VNRNVPHANFPALPRQLVLDLGIQRTRCADCVRQTLKVTADGRIKRILALAHLRNENFSEAIQHAQEAIDNGDLEAVNQLIISIAEAKRGNLDEARRCYERAERTSRLADLPGKDFSTHAAREVLWFESAAALDQVHNEAEKLLTPVSP